MPPEASLVSPTAYASGVPEAWRVPLLRLAIAWAALVSLTWSDWAEMARQWWDASTYNHILIVPAILVWLVRLRWRELAKLAPRGWWPGFVWFAVGGSLWFGGIAAEINFLSQLGAVVLLQASVAVLLGPKIVAGLLFPLGYALFLVPFGDELIPALQAVTARMAVALTHASGVPAAIDGVLIDTPAGLFEVAEACSGVKFLVAMVALGTLVSHLCFTGVRRRAAFMAAAVIVPIVANGVRAWGTIYIAQSQGIEFAAGFDHIVYGWIFFAIVMAVLLGASWRFFDRSPDDPLVDARAIETSPALSGLERRAIGGWRAVAGILVLSAAAHWMDRIAGLS